MKKTCIALLLACSWPLAGWAQSPERLYVNSLAATCANCHGTQGRAISGSTVPTLAGQSREHLATQLKAFKAGTRPATIMHQLAKGYSDQQIELLADYFVSQNR